jgi:uncharacterized protein YndB with AHSA1/START domain
MPKLETTASVEIQAPPERVWQLLTDPAWTPKYMFNCYPVTDWKIGSPVLWEADAEGKKTVYVKGRVVEHDRGKRLRYTVFDPFATYPDVPENYLTVTYTLTPTPAGTRLDVSQGDYATVAEGGKRYQDTIAEGGWGGILQQVKQLAEG